MLSDLKQLNSVAQTVLNCIDVVYKVGSFSIFNFNSSDEFCSISRLKENLMKQCKISQRACVS